MNKDCYFYNTWQDMHAIIPCCTYSGDFDDKKSWSISEQNCENCKQYVPRNIIPNITDVIVRALVNPEYTTDDYYSLCEDIWHRLEKLRDKFESVDKG